MDYGTFVYDGKTLTLTQQPYCDRLFRHNHNPIDVYKANAVDEDENEYLVWWPIVDDETENEDEACDWEDYRVIEID